MSNSERILGIARRIAGMPPEAEADPHMVDKQVDSLDLTEIILENSHGDLCMCNSCKKR